MATNTWSEVHLKTRDFLRLRFGSYLRTTLITNRSYIPGQCLPVYMRVLDMKPANKDFEMRRIIVLLIVIFFLSDYLMFPLSYGLLTWHALDLLPTRFVGTDERHRNWGTWCQQNWWVVHNHDICTGWIRHASTGWVWAHAVRWRVERWWRHFCWHCRHIHVKGCTWRHGSDICYMKEKVNFIKWMDANVKLLSLIINRRHPMRKPFFFTAKNNSEIAEIQQFLIFRKLSERFPYHLPSFGKLQKFWLNGSTQDWTYYVLTDSPTELLHLQTG